MKSGLLLLTCVGSITLAPFSVSADDKADNLLYRLIDPALGPQQSAFQGFSVGVDGNVAVAGVPLPLRNGSGQVNVYDATTGSLLHTLANPKPADGSYFGGSVAISGTRVVVGSRFWDHPQFRRLGACVFVYDLASATPAVPVATLPNPNPTPDDNFGWAVAISGMRVIVGTHPAANASGIAYLYELASATPTVPVATLNSPSPSGTDSFGYSVGISGTRVVIGASSDSTGATKAGRAYVYDLASSTPTVPVATLINPSPAADDGFGYSVAISSARVLVGTPFDDTGATNAGSAYVYDLASPTPAVPVATLTNPSPAVGNSFGFGNSVAISGARAIIGAHLDSTAGVRAGGAYLYDLSSATPTTPVAALTNPSPGGDGDGPDFFGWAVAISVTRTVVGSPQDDTGAVAAGRTYVYDLASVTPTVPAATLPSLSPVLSDRFGSAVAVSGAWVVVGDYADNTGTNGAGSTYLYHLASATPTVPAITLRNPSPAVNDNFGRAVAIAGTLAVVGTPWGDTGDTNAGSVYVYDLTSETPTLPAATLHNPSPALGDGFGYSVAISGTRVVVGVPSDDTGAVNAGSAYVYDLASSTPTVPLATLNNPSPAASDSFGSAVAIDGVRVVVGAYGDDTGTNNSGSAYVYDLASIAPSLPVAILNNPSPGYEDSFGFAVAISGPWVVVGARYDRFRAGSAYVYDLTSGMSTAPVATLTNSGLTYADSYGWAVAISGTRVVVGTYDEFGDQLGSGKAYVYDLASATPTVPIDTLLNPSPWYYDSFGSAVAIDGSIIVVGSNRYDIPGTNQNATYIFGQWGHLSISQAIVTEGNTGTTNAVFTVRLVTTHAEVVSVDFATVDGSATAGSDYIATSGTLVFNPGETNKTISVPVLGDILDETHETFFVRLSNPANISPNQTQAVGTILDDDTTLKITQQPASQSIRRGSNVTFHASAVSTFSAVTYQWRFNGYSLLNATNSSLTVTNVQFPNEGDYTVAVTDNRSFRVSDTARLTVLSLPEMVQPIPPLHLTAAPGETVALSAALGGPTPIFARWRKFHTSGLNAGIVAEHVVASGTEILVLTNVTTNHAGTYTLALTNLIGGSLLALRTNAILTVLPDRDGDRLTDDWELAHSFNPDDAGDATLDSDGDGLSNREEYLAGTDPRDSQSHLKVDAIELANAVAVRMRFLAVSNRNYAVERRESVDSGSWTRLAEVMAAATNRFVEINDTNPTAAGRRFYRIVSP